VLFYEPALADNLRSMMMAPVLGVTAGWIIGEMIYGAQRVPAFEPIYLRASNLRIFLSAMSGLALGAAAWAASSLTKPGTRRLTILRLSVLALLGAFIGVALAFLLPGWDPASHDGPLSPRTYFFWDTMPRFWAASFYGAIGLGTAVVAGLWLRARVPSYARD
jgi:hypothetical protein